MSSYLRVEALDGQGVTLIDESVTPTALDPVVLVGVDWGDPQWEAAYSGPRGTLGRTAVQTQVSDRTVRLPIRFYGSSMDDLAARVAVFARVVDEIRRQGGGRIIRRAHTMGVKASLEVTATTGASAAPWTARSETVPRRDVTVGFTTAPFWEGEPMDADLALVTGADPSGWSYHPASPPGAITLTSTGLQRTGSAADLYIFPDTYQTADHQVTATFIAGGNASQVYGCVGRWVDASNHVRARLVGTTLTVSAIVAGTATLTGTASVTAPTSGQQFTIRLTVHSDGAKVDYFGPGVAVVDAAAPSQTANTATSGPVPTATARPGVLFNSNNQTDQARVALVRVRPYTIDYTGTLPTVVPLRGIPGDVPALGEIQLTARQGFEFGLVGWREAPAAGTVNRVDDGEVFGAYRTSKWSPVGGATLSKQTTGGVSGTDVLRIAGTTTNPSGATRTVTLPDGLLWPRRQRTVECFVRSTSGTVPVQLSAGGQTASGSATTGSWLKLSVSFIPTAAAITIQIAKTGASAGTFDVDDVALYDGPVTTTQRPNAAPAPFGILTASSVPNSGVSGVDASCFTDPSFLVDGGQGGDLVEVWGRVCLHSSLTAATAGLRVRHESGIGEAQWAIDSGSAGRPIATPAATVVRFVRFGTVRLPAGRCYLEPRFTYLTTTTATVTGAPIGNATPSGYSGWTNPGNASSSDGSYATCPQDGVQRVTDFTVPVTVPAGVVIHSVRVRAVNASTSPLWSDVGGITAWLTTDNFATVTTSQSMALGTSPETFTVGGLWGRDWTSADCAALKVRLMGMEASIDQLLVEVAYDTTNPPAVESLILVPARARAVTPTGVASTGWAAYPGAEYRKTLAADLSSTSGLTSAEASGVQTTPGMGGSLIELPPGDVEALVKVSSAVPDAPGTNVADVGTVSNTALHFAVTPRWTVLPEPR